MTTMVKVLRYELKDVLRSRAVLLYTAFFLIVTELLFRFSGDGAKALLALANVTLFVVPLVTVVLGTMFVYGSREFNELLLSQPVHRRHLYCGLYLGFTLPLSAGFVIGVAAPAVIRGLEPELMRSLVLLVVSGLLLTGIFSALAFAIALRFEDRVRGMGLALLAWLFLAVLYDALVLAFANAFWAWPLERPLLVLMLANPVDLARVVLLLNFDVSALMGYTGVVFREFFSGAAGVGVAFAALILWLAAPMLAGLHTFVRKDF
ncbi:MAG: nitrous-oxide metabolic protein NosY [Gemmatimonadetes bacterium]|nr:nitrous-oxide metabolic protein NosY [Gemmatimonadota bacterium]